MTQQGCPGPQNCPLFILQHGRRHTRFACVRDMGAPCLGQRDPAARERLFNRAVEEVFAGLRLRIAKWRRAQRSST